MQRTILTTFAAAIIAVTGGWAVQHVFAQATGCGAGLTPERRAAAVALVRAINTSQASFIAQHGRYGNLQELSGAPGLNTGAFATKVVGAGKQYALMVTDTSNECGHALFTDERGLIYVGAPLQ